MDPGLHVKQAINHLERVLRYAPFVAEGRDATVHLTWEDWNVVADMLFHMSTPREFVPDQIRTYRLDAEQQIIELDTEEFDIKLAIV
ncbi:hypothetical protein ACFLRO_01785 [Bacteroidota bacterium]